MMHGNLGTRVGTGNRSSVSNYGYFSYSGPRITGMSNSTTFQDISIDHDLYTKRDNIFFKIQGISIIKALCKQSETVLNCNGCTVLDTLLNGLYSGRKCNDICRNRIVAKYFGSVSNMTIWYDIYYVITDNDLQCF